MTDQSDWLEDVEFFKRAAEQELHAVIELRAMLLEQHASAFKWLLASLLAINAGAAVAVMNLDSVQPLWRAIGCAPFCLGIFACMLSGQLSQRFNLAALEPLARRQAFWLRAVQTGKFDEEVSKDLEQEMRGIQRTSWVVPGLGWISAVLFAAGTVATGYAIVAHAAVERVGQ